MLITYSLNEIADTTIGEIRFPSNANVRKELSPIGGGVKVISITKDDEKGTKTALVQAKNDDIFRKLAIAFDEDISLAPTARIERHFDKFNFARSKHALIIDRESNGLQFGELKTWLKKNCQEPIVVLRGKSKVHLSFQSQEDFFMTSLRYQ